MKPILINGKLPKVPDIRTDPEPERYDLHATPKDWRELIAALTGRKPVAGQEGTQNGASSSPLDSPCEAKE